MGAKKFSQHRAPVSLAKIAEGMNLARTNASRLAKDAKVLLDAGSVQTAVAIAILSIEESGKVSILRQMVLCEEDAEWRQCWKDYRSHTKKNVTWILGDLIKRGARTIDEMRAIVDSDSDHPQVLDDLKQLCIYTDCVNDVHWTTPAAVSIVDMAAYLLIMAAVLAKGADVTEKELELWRHHLLPVKRASFEENKRAVANWYEDMKRHGLSDKGQDEVEHFLRSMSTH